MVTWCVLHRKRVPGSNMAQNASVWNLHALPVQGQVSQDYPVFSFGPKTYMLQLIASDSDLDTPHFIKQTLCRSSAFNI